MKDQEVQPGGRKWARVGCLGLAALVGLFVLIGEFGPKPGTVPSEPSASKSATAEPEFIEFPQPGISAMIIPAGAKPEQFEAWARERCGALKFCQIIGWTDPARAARTFPMSDREVEAIAFSFKVNRSTDFEQVIWDCKRFPQPDKVLCL